MITVTEKSKCSGCYACYNACPKGCIQMIADEEGFWYPQVNTENCIGCGVCEKVCPIIHKWQPDESSFTKTFAALNKNEEIRLQSSSGGIFTLIAESILEQGGVVFGAAFSDDFRSVHHIYVDKKSALEKLRGSKYVQSNIGDTYQQAKRFLDDGRKVLFTGTPCQIGGLYSFLRKPYENLYTQDIICHGVPSPLVWEKYVEERENKAESKTQRMFFRHKKYGWKTFAVLFEFSNNKKYLKDLQEDPFMRAFLSNACLRPSCHACSFKSIERQADITLADFWGVQSVMPDMDDDKGTSVILIHSKKGQSLIDSIHDLIKIRDVDIAVVEKNNSAVNKSVAISPNRQFLFESIESSSFDVIANRIKPISKKAKVKRMLKRMKFGKYLISVKNRLRNH